MRNTPQTSASPTPTPVPDEAGVAAQLLSLREQVAAITGRTLTLEQTLAIVSRDLANNRELYPDLTGLEHHSIKSLTLQLTSLEARANSLQSQLTALTNTYARELATLNAKFATIEHLLATDPYKITKAKLIKMAKELNL